MPKTILLYKPSFFSKTYWIFRINEKDQRIDELSENQANKEILENKENEINNLRNDIKNLTEENTKFKKSIYDSESEKNSLNQKLNESIQKINDLNNQ